MFYSFLLNFATLCENVIFTLYVSSFTWYAVVFYILLLKQPRKYTNKITHIYTCVSFFLLLEGDQQHGNTCIVNNLLKGSLLWGFFRQGGCLLEVTSEKKGQKALSIIFIFFSASCTTLQAYY